MRPGRIVLFLSAAVLMLSLLSWLASHDRSGLTALFPGTDGEIAVSEPDTATGPTTLNLSPDTTTAEPLLLEDVDYNKDENRIPGLAIADSLASKRQVRIIFYGDSQLEGDRITSHLRKLLRENGGGTGPGMISPVMPVMYTRSFVVKSSSNWKRYTLLDYRNSAFPDNALGPMMSVCRFTEPGVVSDREVKAVVKISPVPGADSTVSRYDCLRIFYGKCSDSVIVRVLAGTEPAAEKILEKQAGISEMRFLLPPARDITIEFSGRSSPDIYSLSLESETGLVMDNIPVRGSAGLEFVMTDERVLREAYDRLKPDLIVLQYGLNVVRNVRSNYNYYEEGLFRQLEYLKKVSGGVPVLLVSLTDMAEKTGDSITSFRNIPVIRDAQRRAAERAGVFFWDAWESMGGTGSIIKWRQSIPALASDDLTHLSNAGADTIASRLFNDLFWPVGSDQTGDTLASVADTTVLLNTTTPPGQEPPDDVIENKGINLFALLRYNPDQSFIFTSPAFWIFFLIVMAGFAVLRNKRALCHSWLLLVSLYFYYKAGGLFFLLLLFTCLITYLTALLTEKASTRAAKRAWMTLNIVILLGLLSYFKYSGFITSVINSVAGTSFRSYDFFSALSNRLFGTAFNVTEIILPVGISFFTFQALSYNIDVYRSKIKAVKGFVDFSFYLTFFPQLVAGPIVRASEFIPQMYGNYSVNRNEFGHALFMILQGLIKKVVISDLISAGFIDRVFEAPGLFSGFENLMAVYGYGLQIYCDFSGYTDIAIGVALLMGFRLPLNFNSPYKAANISDFWKRWHISLSRWLRDYLYIPLGGNRKGRVRTGVNLIVTMVLGGLWHGAAMRFVIWGAIHGVGLAINKVWHRLTGSVVRKSNAARLAGIMITFNFVSLAWIFFRSDTNSNAFLMLSRITGAFDPGVIVNVIIAYLPVFVVIMSGYIIHFLPVTVKESYRGLFIRLPLIIQFIIVIGVCLIVHKVGTGVVQPFIYFRF